MGAMPARFDASAGGGVALLCVSLTFAGNARAELRASAERVAQAWRGMGALVAVEKTRFLNDDETTVWVVPELGPGRCTTVLFLGARGLGFHVSEGAGHEIDPSRRISSEAGALAFERCDEMAPRRLLVASDSGRGALEVVVARSEQPLPRLSAVLPERSDTYRGALPDPGPPPVLPQPHVRADVAERRAKRDGATVGARNTWASGTDGAGAGQEALAPGCHVFFLFGVDPRSPSARPSPLRRAGLDLDAELRDASDDRILARDRADAPDARLTLCVAETTRVGIVFVGSPPSAPVLVSHVAWSLPERLPSIFGGDAKARMARVLLARHVRTLAGEPVFLAQGGSGTTAVPLPVEPGACYLAIASLAQGAARAVGLRVHVGARSSGDDRGIDEKAAAVAFCAGDRSRALAQVDAHGTPLLGWGLAVYRLQGGVWDLPW